MNREGLKPMRWATVLKLLFFLVVSLCVPAVASGTDLDTKTSGKELYELSVQCGKHSAEYFEKTFGTWWLADGEGRRWSKKENGIITHNYRSHYNIKMNKCFIIVTTADIQYNPPKHSSIKIIFDVNENKKYGYFSILGDKLISCEIIGKKCTTEAEWDSATIAYMED
jgi:hypothetical protein